MASPSVLSTPEQLADENATLRAQLAELQETLDAIRAGKVDAILVSSEQGDKVFTLRGAEHPFRVLIEEMNEGAAMINAAGIILYSNQCLAKMLRAPLEQVIGSSVESWVAPNDLTVFSNVLKRKGQHNLRTEVSFCAQDGTLVPCYAAMNTLDLPNDSGMFCIVAADLTDQKRSQAIIASEKLARSILDQAAEAIIVCDEAQKVMRVSQVANALCEINPVGELFSVAFPLKLPNGEPFDIVDILRGENLSGVEVRLKRGEQWLDFLVSASPLLGAELELLGGVITMMDITERNRAQAQTELHLNRLASLREIDIAISGSFELRVIFEILLGQVTQQLRIDAADILLFNPNTQVLEYSAGRGFHATRVRNVRLRLGEGVIGRAALDQRIIQISDFEQNRDFKPHAAFIQTEGFVWYCAVPLVTKGQVKGILEIFHRAPFSPNAEWLNFLETLARQAAIAIDNAELFQDLQRSNMEMALAYDATIEGWSHALDLRDSETEGHSLRVAELTWHLAQMLGMKDTALLQIRRGALLHDIGKIAIPDHILRKPGALTPEEWSTMREHPSIAFKLLLPINYLRAALDIPYCHHEKWDGTGYPRQLQGEHIPLAARLFAIVDVWDALTTARPYRAAWDTRKALDYVRDQSGRHFDPHIVDLFLRMQNELI